MNFKFWERPKRVNVSISDLDPFQASIGAANVNSEWDGEKFFNGLGPVETIFKDYWALRARSAQLFETNLYARGFLRRMVTNEINVGLDLESSPDNEALGMSDDQGDAWGEATEIKFTIYGRNKKICDYKGMSTFGELQQTARLESLIDGDILVVLRTDPKTGVIQTQLVEGSRIQTPSTLIQKPGKNDIIEGVEVDKDGRHVAFWIEQDDGTSKRLAATAPKTGRPQAWLVYGTDKRMNEVRGTPALGLLIQSMQEIDQYRDSTQRKAKINSKLAMFVTKSADKISSKALTGAALKKSVTGQDDTGTVTRNYGTLGDGMVIDQLQTGEDIKGFNSAGIDLAFGSFEESIVATMAWAYEIPPNIMRLAFSSNYSASQAELNEFKIYLNKIRTTFGNAFPQIVYEQYLINEVLQNRIKAPGFLVAWRNPSKYITYGAWVNASWVGAIKPSTDSFKLARGYALQTDEGFITRGRSCRELNGMKYSKVIKQLKKENEQRAEAIRPILELKAEFGEDEVNALLDYGTPTAEEDDNVAI